MKRIFYLCLASSAFAAETGRPPAEETAVLLEAKAKETAGDLAGARSMLERALERAPQAVELRREFYALNKRAYLTEVQSTDTAFYTVRRGDNLTKIADTHAITVGLLRRLNALKNDNLTIGQKLKVVVGPFDVRVAKPSFTMEILQRGKCLFVYPVALGKESSTPVGNYTAGPKLVNPTQYDQETGKVIKFGQPNHAIGTRWITFSGQYGIHGTVEPESIGKAMSHGCVRMLNKDVEEVYDLLVSGKTKVLIADGAPANLAAGPAAPKAGETTPASIQPAATPKPATAPAATADAKPVPAMEPASSSKK